MKKRFYEKMICIHCHWCCKLSYLRVFRIKSRGLIFKLVGKLRDYHLKREQIYWKKWFSYERVHCKYFIKESSL